MRPSEALTIMLYAARIDRRLGTPGEEDGRAWAPLLDGLDPARCLAAVDRHYRESGESIMPSDIRRLARTTTDGEAQSATVAPPGEILCPKCARVHRPEESCEALELRRWPRPIGGVVKAITEEPESPSDAARERALQRARAERGNIPVDRRSQYEREAGPARAAGVEVGGYTYEPPEDAGPPREERDYVSDGRAVTAEDLPPVGLPASRCACGAMWLDYPAGRSAHRAVFGHDPHRQRAEATS